MRIIFAAALLSAAFTIPAFADPDTTTTSAPAPAATAPADTTDQLVCRRKEPPTGSFIRPKPECHTKAEWAAHPNGNAPDAGSGVSSYGGMDSSGHNTGHP
jgi:hypothetical protein